MYCFDYREHVVFEHSFLKENCRWRVEKCLCLERAFFVVSALDLEKCQMPKSGPGSDNWPS